MKRNWRTRRRTNECLDGQLRWDRAYVYLLEWTQPGQIPEVTNAPGTNPSPAPTTQATKGSEEEFNATSRLCPRLDD